MTTFASVRDVADRRRQNPSHIWRITRDGLLPPPIKLGANCTRWITAELDAVDAARIRGADDGDIRKLVRDLIAARKEAA